MEDDNIKTGIFTRVFSAHTMGLPELGADIGFMVELFDKIENTTTNESTES